MIDKLDFAIQKVESVLSTLVERGTIRQTEADVLIEPLYIQLEEERNKERI